MITSWEIYWVLQLDSIGGALTALTAICGIAAVLLLFFGAMAKDCGDIGDDAFAVVKRSIKGLAVAFVVFLMASSLLPSTKTAAAMIVVPAIVNNKTVQHEAGDLYALAKEALKEAIAPKETK